MEMLMIGVVNQGRVSFTLTASVHCTIMCAVAQQSSSEAQLCLNRGALSREQMGMIDG